MTPDDMVAVQAIDSGRSAADCEWFESTVVAALSDLYGTALRLTRNRADAEDLVAETVARGWSHLHELADRTRLRGWLFRILANAFLSAQRTDARRCVHESLDEQTNEGFSLFEQLHAPILLWWGTPEQQFLDKLLREDLTRAVDALPEPFRLVVVLADMHGHTYQEIAETLQVPIGTVRSRLARLVYEPMPDGRMRLVAAEYLVLADMWNAKHPAPPELMGQLFHLTDSPNRYGLPAFYALHVGRGETTPRARSPTGTRTCRVTDTTHKATD